MSQAATLIPRSLGCALLAVGSAVSRWVIHPSRKVTPQNLTVNGLTVPAHGTAGAKVILDLTHRLPYQTGLAKRHISVRVNPVFEGDYAPTPGWQIEGKVLSRVSLDTTLLTFGDMCQHGGEPEWKVIRATAHMPVREVIGIAEPDLAEVRVEPDGDKPGGLRIVVTPKPELPVGAFRFDLTVVAIGTDGKRYECATIPVSGEMRPGKDENSDGENSE